MKIGENHGTMNVQRASALLHLYRGNCSWLVSGVNQSSSKKPQGKKSTGIHKCDETHYSLRRRIIVVRSCGIVGILDSKPGKRDGRKIRRQVLRRTGWESP